MAKVPAKVPSPKRKVAASARISAGKDRSTWIRRRRKRLAHDGKCRDTAPKGETISARADPVTVPVTDIWTV